MENQSAKAVAVTVPKVFIITMFRSEAKTWLDRGEPRFEVSIALPGLSPDYPNVMSTKDGSVCLLTTGESLINAALAVSALTNSSRFDLRESYFIISGIAGVSPKSGTLGSVTFPRFAVQVDLQYEFDARDTPDEWRTAYVPLGSRDPGEYPSILCGTEVYELNLDLRERALILGKDVDLADCDAATEYRKRFAGSPGNVFEKATMKPSVIDGDVASSSVVFHGQLLSEAFEEVFKLFTSGRGSYSMTNQEDNATLGALMRAALQKRIDFARILIMRSASNFDRSVSESKWPAIPLHRSHGGREPALENLYRVGIVVVREILHEWETTFKQGIKPTNYIGDVSGSLGGTPDFGLNVERI